MRYSRINPKFFESLTPIRLKKWESGKPTYLEGIGTIQKPNEEELREFERHYPEYSNFIKVKIIK